MKLLILSMFLLPYLLFADMVELKNEGTIYENVKTFISKGTVEITQENGEKISTPKKNIKKIKFAPVKWKGKGVSNKEILRVMEESIKYTELLQEEIEQTRSEIEKMKDRMEEIHKVAMDAKEDAGKSLQIHWKNAAQSAILPGWGQYSDGFKKKGYVIGGLFALANLNAYRTYKIYQDSLDKYNSDYLTPSLINTADYGNYLNFNFFYFQKEKKGLNKLLGEHRVSLGIMGAIWFYSVIDALFYIPPQIKPISNKSTSWNMDFSIYNNYNSSLQMSETNYHLEFFRSF